MGPSRAAAPSGAEAEAARRGRRFGFLPRLPASGAAAGAVTFGGGGLCWMMATAVLVSPSADRKALAASRRPAEAAKLMAACTAMTAALAASSDASTGAICVNKGGHWCRSGQ